jgi:hypothetical protein
MSESPPRVYTWDSLSDMVPIFQRAEGASSSEIAPHVYTRHALSGVCGLGRGRPA